MECDENYFFEIEKLVEGQLSPNGEFDRGPLYEQQQESNETCKFFLKGMCMKGNSCPFRHTRAEKAVVCKHWLRGLCKKGDVCEFLHEYDLSKMPECWFFSKFGECSNPECMYLHIRPEDKQKECPWYARGFCKHGPKCRHKHVKKLACTNYLMGLCLDGPNCKYGHPKYELPKDEETKKTRTPMICHKCGMVGHKAATCPLTANEQKQTPDDKNGPRPLETVTCYKCGQVGHYANKCPNRRPPGGAPSGNFAVPLAGGEQSNGMNNTIPTFESGNIVYNDQREMFPPQEQYHPQMYAVS